MRLDALRGIAAVGVCLNHVRDLLLTDYSQLAHPNRVMEVFYLATGLGHQWVVIFFVLSGYLVGGSVLRSFALDRWSWRSYLLNRMTRLYAVLVPALLLGGALDLAGIHFFGTSGIYGGKVGSHELNFAIPTRLHLSTLLGNYFFLQGIRVPVFGSNGPLWSLANEFWYYLAFPLLALAVARRSRMTMRVMNLALLAVLVLFVGPSIAFMGIIWLMGVGIHFLPPLKLERPLARRMVLVLALVICTGTLAWAKLHHVLIGDWLLGVAVTALIYSILCCSRTPPSPAYQWTAHALSRSSYTLYLVHVPFVVFLVSWVGRIRLAPDRDQLLLMLAVVLITMAYAQAVWALFEKRTDALREWLKPMVLGSAAKPVARSEASVSS